MHTPFLLTARCGVDTNHPEAEFNCAKWMDWPIVLFQVIFNLVGTRISFPRPYLGSNMQRRSIPMNKDDLAA